MNRSVSEKLHLRTKSGVFVNGPFDDSIIKLDIDFSPCKENLEPSPKEHIEEMARREEFLSMFKYLWFSKEDEKQLIQMKENELVGQLNLLINSFSPKTHPKDLLYYGYKDQTLISLVGPSSKSIGGRFLFRNITGRFAWEFSYIQCLQANAAEKTATYFGDLSESTLDLDYPNIFYEDTAAKVKMPSLKGDGSPRRSIVEKEHRDVFRELFEYIRDHVSEYEEVRFSSDTVVN